MVLMSFPKTSGCFLQQQHINRHKLLKLKDSEEEEDEEEVEEKPKKKKKKVQKQLPKNQIEEPLQLEDNDELVE